MSIDPKILELRQRREDARLGGGQKRIDQQHAKGKLTARERVDLLLDEGSFQELGGFVTPRTTGFGAEKQVFYGDGDAVFGRHNFGRCDSDMPIWTKKVSGTFSGEGGIKGVANQHHLPGAKRL